MTKVTWTLRPKVFKSDMDSKALKSDKCARETKLLILKKLPRIPRVARASKLPGLPKLPKMPKMLGLPELP